jgi:phage terminase large subunit-like protein
MNKLQKVEYLKLLEEKKRRLHNSIGARVYSNLYEWQHQFNDATRTHSACMLMAANQVGKSLTGCVIDSFHLTGDYPDDWTGYKFEHPPMCWLLGYSGEKTRDLLQAKLFGRLEGVKWTGGFVQADKILDWRSMTGTPGAMREVRVQHTHGVSVCQFWSYSQGQHALMGDVVDWYHIDEEPKDQEIYPQVITRTINGDKGRGGRGILTFTPENGKTQLVCKFMDEDTPSQYLRTATWDDAPHLSEDIKESILNQYPEYQRDMRSRGVPLMGAGLIYQHSEKQIRCDPFDIPQHWYIINGMDFGWDHPQAHIQLAWDMGADIFYVTHALRREKTQPYEVWEAIKSWSEDVPTAWPHDGLQTEKGSARQQKDYYEEAGFEMIDEHATWEEGGNGVEAGLMELNNLMKTGRFKVFSHLKEVFEEIREYHRVSKPNGKSEIVKIKDDLVDAIRYAYMMRRHAIQKNDIGRGYYDESETYGDTNAMGY